MFGPFWAVGAAGNKKRNPLIVYAPFESSFLCFHGQNEWTNTALSLDCSVCTKKCKKWENIDFCFNIRHKNTKNYNRLKFHSKTIKILTNSLLYYTVNGSHVFHILAQLTVLLWSMIWLKFQKNFGNQAEFNKLEDDMARFIL